MSDKDKLIYTLTVPCNDQKHQISLTKEGKLKLLNHSDNEIETELALEKLGGKLPECLKIQKAWESNSYYLKHRDDDHVLDEAVTYLNLAYNSRNLFKKKILGLFGVFIAGFIISVIISLIQQTFDLFWIYTFASVNVIWGFYYVFLLLDYGITLEFGIFFVSFIIIVGIFFSLISLHDFKILNIILFLIFMFLYIVPIVLNKVFLKVTSKIEED
ncbi:hypothetical protein PQ692_10275 [Thermoanaerobacterium thermosaccharolyticum]|uniref:hypothetical protein n=1 Tax=Thermoanaerobacterium thermosaccharolyticum TaxID=1517 RepID=UPI003D2A1747